MGKGVCDNRDSSSQSCQLPLLWPHLVPTQSHVHPPGPAFTHLVPGWNLSAVFSVGREVPALPLLAVTPFLWGWGGRSGAQAPPMPNACQGGDTLSTPEVPLPRGPLEKWESGVLALHHGCSCPPDLSLEGHVGKCLPCTWVTPGTLISLSSKSPLEAPGHSQSPDTLTPSETPLSVWVPRDSHLLGS